MKISIHALVKRATVFTKARYNIDNISIHALVKRATFCFCSVSSSKLHFNPRPREEGDCALFDFFSDLYTFQSTPS